jgi:hypothetical protein
MTIQAPFDKSTETIDRDRAPKPAPRAASATTKPARVIRPGAVELPLLLGLVCIALIYAWMRRDSGDLTAETGTGYVLGIVGGIMMLTLLAYPLRKRLRVLRFLGNVRGWFRLHMILGILGPTAIILHSNFTLGSLNGTAAMASMLVVAASGLAGRFLYARIHRGLYGRKESLRDRLAEIDRLRKDWNDKLTLPVNEMLTAYQTRRLEGVATFLGSFATTMTGPISRTQLSRRLKRQLRLAGRNAGVAVDQRAFSNALHTYFKALGRAEAFLFYERLFAAWHLLHLPLFLILVLSAIAHVVAVHLY